MAFRALPGGARHDSTREEFGIYVVSSSLFASVSFSPARFIVCSMFTQGNLESAQCGHMHTLLTAADLSLLFVANSRLLSFVNDVRVVRARAH